MQPSPGTRLIEFHSGGKGKGPKCSLAGSHRRRRRYADSAACFPQFFSLNLSGEEGFQPDYSGPLDRLPGCGTLHGSAAYQRRAGHAELSSPCSISPHTQWHACSRFLHEDLRSFRTVTHSGTLISGTGKKPRFQTQGLLSSEGWLGYNVTKQLQL